MPTFVVSTDQTFIEALRLSFAVGKDQVFAPDYPKLPSVVKGHTVLALNVEDVPTSVLEAASRVFAVNDSYRTGKPVAVGEVVDLSAVKLPANESSFAADIDIEIFQKMFLEVPAKTPS